MKTTGKVRRSALPPAPSAFLGEGWDMKTPIRRYAFLLVCCAFTSSFAIQVGYFNYQGYLGNANGDTMKVNDTMVAMSDSIYVKAQNVISSFTDTPSVFFIIDNSSSMNYNNGGQALSDTNGYRYKLDSAMVEMLYQQYPSAKVGIAAFDADLIFTTTQDANIMQVCPAGADAGKGAYMKLLTLNQLYTGPDGVTQYTGRYLAHLFLSTGVYTVPTGDYNTATGPKTCVDLYEDALRFGANGTGGTNIGIGFEAAKNAFIGDSHVKAAQYIIFQSDGAANQPANPWAFMTPPPTPTVDSVPTTFVFYYNRSTTEAAQDLIYLDTMTARIGHNNYSTSNPKSELWPFVITSFGALVDSLTTDIYTTIQGVVGNPTQIIIGTDTAKQWMTSDSDFAFNGLFPLTGALTPFTSQISYRTTVNGSNYDSTLTINFWADRIPAATISLDSFKVWRWDRLLMFRYNGAVIPAINPYMDSVELRFGYSPGTAGYNYHTVQVQVTTRVPPIDSEFYTLTQVPGTDTFSVKLKDTLSTAVKGDGIIEYKATDTIVAIFRNQENPKLPLDTLKIVCPIQTLHLGVLPRYDTLIAGDTLSFSDRVMDGNNNVQQAPSMLIHWTEVFPVPPAPGDQILLPNGTKLPAYPSNQDTAIKFTATEALRSAYIVASYDTTGTAFSCTTFVYIIPNRKDHIVIENSPNPPPNQNNPLGGLTGLIIPACLLYDTGYVVWRDQFQNFISFDTTVTWSIYPPYPPDSVVSVTPENIELGQGIINRGSEVGKASVIATDVSTGKTDTVSVTNSLVTYDSVRIEVYNPATGTYSTTGLNPLTLASPASITLYAAGQLLGQNQYNNITAVSWFMSPNLSTSIPVPGGQQNSWTVTPTDTGHGYIGISYCQMRDSIPVVFGLGTPTAIGIYPQSGPPSAQNVEYPPAPGFIAKVVTAGVIDTLYAQLSFTIGGQTYYLPNTDPRNASITWTISPVEPGRDTLENATNYFGYVSSTRAWQNVTVTATYGPTNVYYSVLLRIVPGAINRLVFLGNSTIPDSGNVVDTIVSPLTVPTTDSLYDAYAVLVDKYYNFDGFATAAKWSSTNTAYATVRADTPSVGEGTIAKTHLTVSGVMDSVIAYDTVNNVRDTLPVSFLGYYYTSIFIGNALGTALAYDTVLVSSQSTLYAWGVPSNGQPPAQVSVTWSNSPGLSLNPTAPSQATNWTFTADSVGNGWIKITRSGLSGPLTDSIPCVFIPGAVSRLVLYRQPGPPSPALIFPAIDSIVSEASDTIDAKVFDNNGNWLSLYEQYPLDTLISWSIVKRDGPAGSGADTVLAAKKGNITSFTPHIAYCLYKITATFSQNGITVSDSAEIYVNPGAATQLLIEASEIVPGTTSSNLLVGDHPISPPDTLRFGATDSMQYVYAVLRDKDGNFVAMCPNVQWISLSNAIVTARPGPQSQQGQGQINRALGATTGTTKVFAYDESNLNYYDSVDVALEAYSYKRLLIIVNNTVADSLHSNDTLRVPSDQDTSLEVVAQLSDNSIRNLNSILANWVYLSNSGSANQAATDFHEWTFSPGKTGNGMIIASSGSVIPDTVCIIVLPGSPASVVLYDSMGPPSATIVPLPNPTTAITLIAGRPFLMAAKVFDANGLYLAQYDLDSAAYNPFFSWSAANPEGGSLNGYLDAGRIGVTQHFTDPASNDSAYVIVQLPVRSGLTLKDTVLLHVIPDTATHMVLENSLVYNQHIPPNPPWDTLSIPNTSVTGSVYAILRDRFQNAVGYDTMITSVVALDDSGHPDTSVISVSLGNRNTGQVIASRNTSGTAWLVATDAKGFSDTCVVLSLPYGYKELRIVAPNDTGPHSKTPLVITTDQDDTLYVQAERTDTALWVSVAATWQLSPGLAGLTPPGQPASSFSVAPTDTGIGWIRVTLGEDSIVAPDTMQVHLTAGAPVQAVIQIITPASQRVAGQPIKGVVVLQDVHGNTVDIPTTVFTTASGGGAYYADTLGSGGKPAPFLIADGNTVMLDHISPDSCSETFTNGVDTIYFTLYNAPPDSDFIVIPHQISVSLKNSGTATPITGVSPPFKLYPGPIAGLQIQTADGTPIHMDTLSNDIKPFNTYFSRGYDQYGNFFGTMNSNWHVTGSLHAPTVDTIGQGSVYYNATADSESGYLVAIYDTAYSDSSVHAYSDSVYIIIKPSSATLVTAITRDWDGTGYLDHFDLIFSRKVQLPTDSASIAAFAAAVKISSPDPSTTISVKGIVFPILPSDSIWTVTLNNNHPDSVLQTGWEPDVTMLSFPQADIGATPAIIARDGAGPVIARAIKQKLSIAGNTHDQVTVTFSEQLRSVPQNSAPSAFLDVWVKDSAGRYIKDSTLLSGIPGPLAPVTDDSQAIFFMTNDSNITLGHYYVSIDSARAWAANVQICDLYGNRPDSNNRKVLVTFNSSPSGPLVISPNPMRRPGTVSGGPHLVIQDNSNNISDPVSNNGGGVKMTFDVPVPNTGDTGITVQAAVAIYDVVGNLVISGQNSRFIYYNGSQWILDNGSGGESIADLVGTGSIVRPSIYWSGENGRGMTVAPGVYRGIVALHYVGSGKASYGDQRSSANIGVMHAAR